MARGEHGEFPSIPLGPAMRNLYFFNKTTWIPDQVRDNFLFFTKQKLVINSFNKKSIVIFLIYFRIRSRGDCLLIFSD
ncbi:MAG: hypothetical protein COU10_03450 [Candidatus Harrisonbacteria bacterium CG10_big_fil_rev_8_21_14_0_10_45_28]|uniref:Uncharacterized protein n=1 Tax=Candidatus Harrisonbacteria bacterium CG10_big_fil_rev_8_21_14_0_10_45_28 TaxID=1974586 RepID=A0A2H0UPD5_9BACT|nr:MAG: hypothetical protein COU10_03450 [Candidatus Harrisonbacteria bacterium CG10_big_fil_rev_8_21_14_0_10_45_28]